MNKADLYYFQNLRRLQREGIEDYSPRPKYKDGTPAHTLFITNVFEEYDISKNEFPIPTLRNTAIKTGIQEIFWIYQDESNSLEKAHKRGIFWWDEWDIGDGTIGPRYGATVRKYDLVNNLIKGLKENPYGRDHIIDLWQEEDLREKGLKPCAYSTVWNVRGEYLDCHLNQRSNDYIMAGYINKIQYVAFQMMISSCVGLKPGKFTHLVNNLHIYDRHIPALEEIKSRKSLFSQPILQLTPKNDFKEFKIEDFKIVGTEKIPKLTNKLELAI